MIKFYKELTIEDLSLVGEKVKGLLLLKSKGYKVPDFHVIDSATIAEWIKKTHRNEDRLKEEIRKFLEEASDEVFQKTAIRSAILGEDSVGHSFAGIHESVLNIKNKEEALVAIVKAVHSGFSKLAINYRKNNKLALDNIGISIIVQKMVDPLYAGVSFGVDLESGCRKSVWISVTEGLGDKLVSGEVHGQEYLYKDGQFFEKTNNCSLKNMSFLKEI
ncbi:MAG: hypothetical protein KDD45_18045, partial [Bdellovibrionales bacterium]|nr:hypothetical protein [Bdellovibrionales bacterium]